MDPTSEVIQSLGITAAPLVVAGVKESVGFFRTHLQIDPLEWVDYFKGIDFHKPVRRILLESNTPLIRHDSAGASRPKPFVYYTRVGASPTRLGTTFPQTEFQRFRVVLPVWALESVASTLSFGLNPRSQRFDSVSRLGGELQYIVAERDPCWIEKL